MKVYLVILNGMGDFQGAVIDKETFDWIQKPWQFDGESSGEDPLPEKARKAAIFADPEAEGIAYITIGTYNNDRALYVGSTIEGYKNSYWSTVEMFMAVHNNGDEVADAFEGSIY